MEQAAHQNAANLEGLLRRWIPEGPPPPIPGTPLDMPREPDFEEREALEESGEEGADEPFPSSHLFGGECMTI